MGVDVEQVRTAPDGRIALSQRLTAPLALQVAVLLTAAEPGGSRAPAGASGT
ncbi:hypothetical protein [Streptomyces sp. NPDC102476]|uniref:hypothetical protein n=1 Tax=Streptomyces sp. NPDC102476 TaxID=3366181 RepID=UPI003807ABD3